MPPGRPQLPTGAGPAALPMRGLRRRSAVARGVSVVSGGVLVNVGIGPAGPFCSGAVRPSASETSTMSITTSATTTAADPIRVVLGAQRPRLRAPRRSACPAAPLSVQRDGARRASCRAASAGSPMPWRPSSPSAVAVRRSRTGRSRRRRALDRHHRDDEAGDRGADVLERRDGSPRAGPCGSCPEATATIAPDAFFARIAASVTGSSGGASNST